MKPLVRWNMENTVYDAYKACGASSSELHGHRHFLLTLITRGKGLQILNGEEIPFREGDVFLLSPADFHKNLLDIDESYDFYGVKFKFETLDPRLSAIFGLNALPIHISLSAKDYQKATALFSELVAAAEATPLHSITDVYKKTLVEQLIIVVMQNLNGSLKKHESPFAVRMLEYLYSHFCEHISVSDAAAYVGYTPNHFNTIFRTAFGTPFSEYLWTMRLEYAKNLVSSNEMPLTDVAAEAGFLSLAHFSRKFKEKYGLSPKEYRKGKF